MDYQSVLNILLFTVMLYFGVKRWWESGFWCPMWVHVLAAIMLLVGLGLWLLAVDSDHPKKDLHSLFIFGFPIAVYFVFVMFGGGKASIRMIGDYITYHASIDKDDVKSIFKEYVSKYLNQPVRKLLDIGEFRSPIEINTGKNRYSLNVKSRRILERHQEPYISVVFILEKQRLGGRYTATACTEILYSDEGEILINPVEGI